MATDGLLCAAQGLTSHIVLMALKKKAGTERYGDFEHSAVTALVKLVCIATPDGLFPPLSDISKFVYTNWVSQKTNTKRTVESIAGYLKRLIKKQDYNAFPQVLFAFK